MLSAYLRLLIFFFPGNLDSSLCFIQPSRYFFPEFFCFFYDPMAVGNLISGSSAFNPDWTSGSFQVTYCWSLAWRIRSITLLACEMSAIVQWFEHFLALPFFGIGMKTDLFQSCGHCWVFQICWHIERSTLTIQLYTKLYNWEMLLLQLYSSFARLFWLF